MVHGLFSNIRFAHTSFVARILFAVFLLFVGGRGVDGNTCGYSLATPGIGYDRWMTTSLPYPPLTHIHYTAQARKTLSKKTGKQTPLIEKCLPLGLEQNTTE